MATAVQIASPIINFKAKAHELLPAGCSYDSFPSCGLCSSGCPVSGLEGMDPRQFIRMAMLDMNHELGRNERKFLGSDLAGIG